jgi:monoamine oxidase
MHRKEFVQKSLSIGMGLPFLSSFLFSGCGSKEPFFPNLETSFKGTVIIIGAGAAGLSAAYALKKNGISFRVVEAAPVIGGRLKRADTFADFPIDLGAEWIHTEPDILSAIANNSAVSREVETIEYNPQTIQAWNNGKLNSHNYVRYLYSEWKFKRSTWFGFFERYLLPEIEEHIQLNTPITQVNYSGNKVLLTSATGEQFEADKVLITASINVLQQELISFQPELPNAKKQAFDQIYMGDGIKVFIQFKERFYPDMIAFGGILEAFNDEEKFVYDAAFGKDSNHHILGLFAINEKASVYSSLSSDDAIIKSVLAELDELFDGKASQHYVKHIIQNWSNEPYIRGAYSYSFEGKKKEIIRKINDPINNKIYFAGEALSMDNQSMVHGACESGFDAVKKILVG